MFGVAGEKMNTSGESCGYVEDLCSGKDNLELRGALFFGLATLGISGVVFECVCSLRVVCVYLLEFAICPPFFLDQKNQRDHHNLNQAGCEQTRTERGSGRLSCQVSLVLFASQNGLI